MLYLGLFIDFTDLDAELGHKLQMLDEVRDLEQAKVLEQVPFNDKNLVTTGHISTKLAWAVHLMKHIQLTFLDAEF